MLYLLSTRALLSTHGYAGIIVQSGIASDNSHKDFFGDLVARHNLVSLFDFVNTEGVFPGIHRTHPHFCALTITKSNSKYPMKFAFYLTRPEHLGDERRLFTLSTIDLSLLNPNTLTCPVFRTQSDATLTMKIYRQTPVLLNEKSKKSPWRFTPMLMFMMSNASELFRSQPSEGLVPLYEAKLLHQFTHRWATYSGEEVRELTHEEICDPNCVVRPRYWIPQREMELRLTHRWKRDWLIAFRDITNATNERTAIFSLLPRTAVGNTAPIVFLPDNSACEAACFLASVNSLTFDFVTRQKIGGTHMTFGYVYQLPVLPPSTFSADDIAFISERVLELVYTAWDMQPFAQDVWAEMDEEGKRRVLARNVECNRDAPADLFEPRNGFPLPPFRWNDERRALIRAELDARIARLYGLTRDELRYILDPADVYGPDFPGETFRVLKEKEIRQHGEYRTRRLVLEAWDREHERQS